MSNIRSSILFKIPRDTSKVPCNHFKNGNCKNGDNRKFAHPEKEVVEQKSDPLLGHLQAQQKLLKQHVRKQEKAI